MCVIKMHVKVDPETYCKLLQSHAGKYIILCATNCIERFSTSVTALHQASDNSLDICLEVNHAMQ